MDFTGIIKKIGSVDHISDSFKKRDLVVTVEGQYPQHIALQLTQDRCGLVESYKEGDEVHVYFNLRGREWTSPQGEVKYFNTLDCWKIAKVGDAASASEQKPEAEKFPSQKEAKSKEEQNDLPW